MFNCGYGRSTNPFANPIIIVKGDDTDAIGYNTIPCTINTTLDLTGCEVVFSFLGFTQEFTNVVGGETFDIVIPSSVTSTFPLCMQFASLYVIDADKKKRTFSNTIPVKVTLNPQEGQGRVGIEFNPIAQVMKGDNFDMYSSDWDFRKQFAMLIKKLGATVSNDEEPED